MQYVVPTSGDEAFEMNASSPLKFTSDDIYPALKEKVDDVDIQTKIMILMNNDDTGEHEYNAPRVYESVIAHHLSRGGVCWQKKTRNMMWGGKKKGGVQEGATTMERWEEFSLSLEKCVFKLIPFSEMIPNCLYYPKVANFPFVEFYYKSEPGEDGEVELVAFQVTRQKPSAGVVTKQFTVNAMTSFLDKISLLDSLENIKLRVVLIPRPVDADNAVFVPVPKKANADEITEKLTTYEVWHLPTDYSSGVSERK
jgi:hypothetical protein